MHLRLVSIDGDRVERGRWVGREFSRDVVQVLHKGLARTVIV